MHDCGDRGLQSCQPSSVSEPRQPNLVSGSPVTRTRPQKPGNRTREALSTELGLRNLATEFGLGPGTPWKPNTVSGIPGNRTRLPMTVQGPGPAECAGVEQRVNATIWTINGDGRRSGGSQARAEFSTWRGKTLKGRKVAIGTTLAAHVLPPPIAAEASILVAHDLRPLRL